MAAERVNVDLGDLRNRYLAGESLLTISKSLGVSRPTLRRRLKGMGFKIRGQSEAMAFHYQRLSPEERGRCAEAAHAAVRGFWRSWALSSSSLSSPRNRASEIGRAHV